MTDFQPPQGQPSQPATSTGLEPNVASLLCYLAGWLTGLIFFLIEKRNKEVRFHAAQSMLLFGGVSVVFIVLSILSSAITVLYLLVTLLWLASAVAWVVLMVFAFQGKYLRIPGIAPTAEKMAAKLPQ